MTMMKRTIPMVLATLALAATALSAALPRASAGPRCHKVSATLEDSLVTEGCTSPYGLCTAGTIAGDGLLQGSFFNVVENLAPAATEGNLTFDLSNEFTTDRGTITFHGSAIFDPVHGAISIIALDPTGDGDFAGATGRLFLHANVSPTRAEGVVTGEICLPE
jgi:hypothetical protein